MIKIRNIILFILLIALSSCNCDEPLKVSSIQKTDKKLACKDIVLEINEAEHYREEAKLSKGVSLSNIFAPTCWVTGYIDSAQAVDSANARIDYLGHIYDLLDCGGKTKEPMPNALKSRNEADKDKKLDDSKATDQSKSKQNEAKSLHEHILPNGKKIRHSHPYEGPHDHDWDKIDGNNAK